eukprot:431742-Pyramimonas_sp.AAC.1
MHRRCIGDTAMRRDPPTPPTPTPFRRPLASPRPPRAVKKTRREVLGFSASGGPSRASGPSKNDSG